MSKRLKICVSIIIVLDFIAAFSHGFFEVSPIACFAASVNATIGGFLLRSLL